MVNNLGGNNPGGNCPEEVIRGAIFLGRIDRTPTLIAFNLACNKNKLYKTLDY